MTSDHDTSTPDKALIGKKQGRKRPPETLKLGYILTKLSSYYFGARYNDLVHGHKKKRFAGVLPMQRKVAVFLIFPSGGLKQSHLDSLAYITAKGYAPVVVSNVCLSDAERDRLLPHVTTYIERFNFGYDFGGFRDGVLEVGKDLPTLEKLVLLNNSSWFPLPNGSDWIATAEALPFDYVGASTHHCYPMPKAEDFHSITWLHSDAAEFFHYTSFAVMFGSAILQDRAFLAFWKRFPLTNIKRVTVRRGEVGLTRWVRSHGYSHGGTLDLRQFDTELAGLSDGELRQIICEMPVFESDLELLPIKADLLADPHATKADLISFILTAVARQGPSYALVAYLVLERGFPFLKKSPAVLMANSAEIMRRLVARLDGPLGETIRAEALELAEKAPKTDTTAADRP